MNLTLNITPTEATMTGGKHGSHTITYCGEPKAEWNRRVQAHWAGYQQNNGQAPAPVAAPKPVKSVKPLTYKTYTVTIRFQSPAWDEVNGIPYTGIEATSKSAAIKQVRRLAWDDGHTALATGKGRITFTATETE